ncbi:MAG: hypothetical protein OQK98_11040 [Gammaproteobacteria bacterium]|nr:hypothetical protein [Gammaproteobacteria bacterium]
MKKKVFHFGILFSMLGLLFACAPSVKDKPVVIKAPPVITPVIVDKVIPVPPESEQPEQQQVLVLLSSSASAFQQIGKYITKELGDNAVQITLSGLPAQDQAVIRDIQNSTTTQVVAVGSKALDAVKSFKDKQIIYTQILHHDKALTKNIKGVSSLPSPEKLFKDWKKLSPTLTKVAVVAGRDLDLYLKRAKKAARSQGIELIVGRVNSDKGFIYKSKKLKSDVGGQWILPDNRILSGKALKEVMAYASRRGRQIVVFSPNLLSFGGFFYVTPDLDAIAKGVLKRLAESAGKSTIPGDNVLPIMSHTIGINQNIAKQLNLVIPQEYRKYVNGK